MDIRELRIGNLVTTKFSNEILTIKYISSQTVKDGEYISAGISAEKSYMKDHLEPIPLTTEWIERFGFEKIQSYTFACCYAFVGHKLIKLQDNTFTISHYTKCVIKHVHQLQNLYFALTVEELTLKEK